MLDHFKLKGLTAAVHSPFDPQGRLNIAAIDQQAGLLAVNGITSAFVCGTTGECSSLSLRERLTITERWSEAAANHGLQLVVHVGTNCLSDARRLARHAQLCGARAISACAPCYFKPSTVPNLVFWCKQIASSAPKLPFYFYHIPSMTGVHHPMDQFLDCAAQRIPNLVGIKFTSSNLLEYQSCVLSHTGRFDILWGSDESLLAATVLGATGAIGSTYNFAAPLYRQMLTEFERGNVKEAADLQSRAATLIATLSKFGYLSASKFIMKKLSVDVGTTRPPLQPLSKAQEQRLSAALDRLGFDDLWSMAPT